MKTAKKVPLILLVLFSCVGCDQATKSIARKTLAASEPIHFLMDSVRLQYAENPGAFLGLGASTPEHLRYWVFTAVVGLLLAGMLIFLLTRRQVSKTGVVAISLVFSGGVGNLIDRLGNEGRVIDFMNLGIGPLRTGVFNVADVAITVGCIWLFALSFNKSFDNL